MLGYGIVHTCAFVQSSLSCFHTSVYLTDTLLASLDIRCDSSSTKTGRDQLAAPLPQPWAGPFQQWSVEIVILAGKSKEKTTSKHFLRPPKFVSNRLTLHPPFILSRAKHSRVKKWLV